MGLMCLQVRRSQTGSAANGMNVGWLDGEETGPANRKLCGCNGVKKTWMVQRKVLRRLLTFKLCSHWLQEIHIAFWPGEVKITANMMRLSW